MQNSDDGKIALLAPIFAAAHRLPHWVSSSQHLGWHAASLKMGGKIIDFSIDRSFATASKFEENALSYSLFSKMPKTIMPMKAQIRKKSL